MDLDLADRVLHELSRERRLSGIHLAGGEAGLQQNLLQDVIKLAVKRGVPLDYLETNAAWCRDRDETREGMVRLREAGLPAILVSASMFHNEFIPFTYTKNAVEVGREVFGYGNVIVWTPQLYEMLSQLPEPDKTRPLSEFCRFAGIPRDSRQLPNLYGIIPGGRVPQGLGSCYPAKPADAFSGANCAGEIFSVTHFHIDPEGYLFTGFCAGLVAETVEDFHPEIKEETKPLLHLLSEEGPYGLMQMAQDNYGFEPDPEGYVSKCDLCFQVRKCLLQEKKWPELAPEDFYLCQ